MMAVAYPRLLFMTGMLVTGTMFLLWAGFVSAQANENTGQITGNSELMVAVQAGDVARVASLLETGVDVNRRNTGGVTALMFAATAGRDDLVRLLLNAGARPDIQNYEGSSAADLAAGRGHDQLAAMLKEAVSEKVKQDKALGYDFADDAYVDVKYPAWFKQGFLDLQDDFDTAIADGKQGILLFIGTRRCSYCKAFLDKVLSVPDIEKRVRSSYDVIGLEIFSDLEMTDVDGTKYRVRDFVTKVKASYTPTFIFYRDDGSRVLKIVGYYPKEKFEQVLDYLDGQFYQKESLRAYLDRMTKSESASSGKMIIDHELFSPPPHSLDRRFFKAERPTLVVFESNNCETCKRLHKGVLSDRSIRDLIGGYDAMQLDIENTDALVVTPEGKSVTAGQWYAELGLSYLPAILFFDEAGNEVMRLDSETLRYRMEGTLQLVLEKAYMDDAQLQRWRRGKAIKVLEQSSGSEQSN